MSGEIKIVGIAAQHEDSPESFISIASDFFVAFNNFLKAHDPAPLLQGAEAQRGGFATAAYAGAAYTSGVSSASSTSSSPSSSSSSSGINNNFMPLFTPIGGNAYAGPWVGSGTPQVYNSFSASTDANSGNNFPTFNTGPSTFTPSNVGASSSILGGTAPNYGTNTMQFGDALNHNPPSLFSSSIADSSFNYQASTLGHPPVPSSLASYSSPLSFSNGPVDFNPLSSSFMKSPASSMSSLTSSSSTSYPAVGEFAKLAQPSSITNLDSIKPYTIPPIQPLDNDIKFAPIHTPIFQANPISIAPSNAAPITSTQEPQASAEHNINSQELNTHVQHKKPSLFDGMQAFATKKPRSLFDGLDTFAAVVDAKNKAHQDKPAFASSGGGGDNSTDTTLGGDSESKFLAEVKSEKIVFEHFDDHHANSKGEKSPPPTNPKRALENSVKIKDTSTRRVYAFVNELGANEFGVLDEHLPNRYHGHRRSWEQLTQEMKNALQDARKTNEKGKIL